MWNEAVSCAVNEVTFSGHTNSCEYIISCTHNLANVRIVEFIDDAGSSRFQFIFEDDEA